MSKFKNIIFIITFLLLFVNVYSASRIGLYLEDVSPSIIKPGEDFVLKINVENLNDNDVLIDDINLNLKDKFSLISASGDNFDTLCGRCQKSVIFYIKSNKDLESSLYPIEINVDFDSDYNKEEKFFVKILGEPKLILNPTITGDIYPGSIFNISFNLENVGSNDANNIQIVSNSDQIGFLNKNSLFIDEIRQKENFEILGQIVSSENLENGFFQIPFTLSYEDNENNKYSVDENIGVNVLDKASLVIQNLKINEELEIGKRFNINLRVENDGFGTAENVVSKIDGDFLGEKVGFFGTIKKNEDLPQIYSLIPQKSGENIIKITVEYKDDYGLHYLEKEHTIYVKSNLKEKKYFYILWGVIFLLFITLIILSIIKHKKRYGY